MQGMKKIRLFTAIPAFLLFFFGFIISSARSDTVNLNKATLREILELPGMTIIPAQRIIRFRETQGEISDVNELVRAGILRPEQAAALRNNVRFTTVDRIHPGRIDLGPEISMSDDQEEKIDVVSDSTPGGTVSRPERVRPSGVAEDPAVIFRTLLGMVREGRAEYAAPRLQRFIDVMPNSEFADDARYLLGSINEEAGDYVEALQHYLDIERRFQGGTVYGIAILRAAICYDHLGNYNRAVEYYSKALASSQNAPWWEMCRNRLKELSRFVD